MKSSLEKFRSLRAKKSSRLSRRVQRARALRVETMEPRHMLAGFIQGFAFIDGNNDNILNSGDVRKENATIELRSPDGLTLLASTVTNSDGYYRFDNLASGVYRLRENAPGYQTLNVQMQNLLSSATAINSNTEMLVTLTEPDDPLWQDDNLINPPNPNPLTVHRLPGLPGVNSAFTLAGAPFNSATGVTNNLNAHQFELFLTGGALAAPTPNFYSFCMDLFHFNPATFAVTPSLNPMPPGVSANLGRIGYLYNEFGTQLLSPTLGTGMQLALYELVYDVSPDLSSGNYVVNSVTTDPAAYAAAANYLALSAGKDQRAVFLNVGFLESSSGRQGQLVTENFNFNNKVVEVQGDLRITITPDDTNEVGQPHTFTALVEQNDGLAIGAPGGDAYNGFGAAVGAAVSLGLTNLNGASTSPTLFAGVTNASGQFSVTFTSATGGIVVGNATATHLVNSVSLTRDTDPATVAIGAGPGGSGPAYKRFVDAKIVITPDDVNEVGAPHTFTATVYADNGDGIDSDGVMGNYDAVGAGEDVAITLANSNGAVAVPAGPLAGVTNALGQFSVTFTSFSGGIVTGSATSNVDVGGLVLSRTTNGSETAVGSGVYNSGPATKKFVDAKIVITPDDVNEVGAPHTFTATVYADNGDGIDSDGVFGNYDAVGAGEDVAITLANSNGAVAVPAGPLAGVTNALGQFSVTFTSFSGGIVTGSATSNVDVGGLVLPRTTDGSQTVAGSGVYNSGPATKKFVDAKIVIAPDATNAVGDPHTFTATVYADNGDGVDSDGVFGNYDAVGAGEDVAITLTNSNGAVAVPAGPLAGFTDANGQFSVTFTSLTAGLVVGSATSNVDVGGLVLSRTTNGSETAVGSGVYNSGPATKRFVDAKISITPNATNEVGDPHTFTVTVLQDDGLTAAQGGDGVTGFTAATIGNVDVTLTDSNGAVSILDTVNSTSDDNQPIGDNLDNNGQTTTVFTSNSAGVVTGHATVTLVVGGITLTRETNGLAGNSGDATKRFVDAKILITPDAVNEVGDPHTFTVTVLEDDGLAAGAPGGDSFNGFAPAAGESVNVTLTNTNGASAPVTNFAGTSNASGQFQVTFSSPTAGVVIGNASSSILVGGLSLTRDTNPATASIDAGPGGTGPATKRFVDARILITPDAVNAVGDPHTFTVTVQQDDGLTAAQGGDGVTGFTSVGAGKNVTVSLANANGAVAVPSTALAGVTNASGQFQVTFSSASAGLVIGNASTTFTLGGVSLTRDTNPATAAVAGPGGSGPATKRFVDAKILIGPDGVNPVGDPHTFTVTVLKDDGLTAAQGGDGVTGFTAATVGNVDVTLTNSNGANAVVNLAASTSDDNQPIGDNLNNLGQTTTVFTSATAGTVVGHATVTLVIDGVTLVRETNGLAGNSVDAVKKFVKPGIDIEKTTNGPTNANPIAPDYDNEDSENGPGVPILTPGSTVTWTYKVKNTGGVDYASNEVVIVDDNGTPANLADDMSTTNGQITFFSVLVGDGDNILEPGEEWLYKASGIVQTPPASGSATTFDFSGNTALDGTDGNTRTYTSGGISVNASAFSRDKSNGAWSAAWLGAYGGGLGVTDSSEGSGGSNGHTVDNVGRDNYVLFEFSESVVIDSAFLGFVAGDSDLTLWIGTVADPFNNHLTLSDALLTSLGFTEVNTGGSSNRTADLNSGEISGNVIVIAARIGESNDYFKIEKMTVGGHGCYENKAVVTVPGATDSDWSRYCTPPKPIVGRISGTKYLDITGNGLSADDTGLGGTTIQLYRDKNNDGSLTAADGGPVATTTSAAGTGDYSFENLAIGRYFVKEIVGDDYIRTGPKLTDTYTVVVSADSDICDIDFANFDKSKCVECGTTSVTNIKYTINGSKVVTDLRGNTNQGDTVQVSFTIVAGAAPTQLTLVSYTAPSGSWVVSEASQQKIFDLDTGVFGPGTYTLEVNIPNSFYQIDFVCGAAIDVLGPEGSNIFYTPQKRLFHADNDGTLAVLSNGASLSGVVFVDSSNFGVRDAGEVGIGNVKVTLTGTDKNGQAVNLVRYTKSDGSYLFNNLRAGTYTITQTQPTGFTDGIDILGSLGGTLAADQFKSISVALGSKGINYNFGEKLTTAGSGASAAFQVDPLDSTKAAIVVNGTSSTDVIDVSYASNKYTVKLNGTTLASLNNKDASNRSVVRLIVNGNAGNDDIRVDSSVTVMTEIYGGEGHDRLIGGGGNNILVGGNGNDYIVGNNTLRDLIFAGNGADVVSGGGADDLVVAGVSAFDSNATALRAIFAEWNSARDYTTRVNNIRGTSPGTRANGNTFLAADKLFDDGEVDTVTGAGGRDWYLLHTGVVAKDVISDWAADEVFTDV